MVNLLKETIEMLKSNDKNENNVRWCGSESLGCCTFEHFKSIANIEYDGGFGGQEIATDLMVVGDDFWLERHEYDGSEWWEYKQIPLKPDKNVNFKSCKDDGYWNSLEDINQ